MKNKNKGKNSPPEKTIVTLNPCAYVTIGAGKEARMSQILRFQDLAGFLNNGTEAAMKVMIRSANMRIEAWRDDETGQNFGLVPVSVTCPATAAAITSDFDINASVDLTDAIESKLADITSYFASKKHALKMGTIFVSRGKASTAFTQAFRLRTSVDLTDALRKYAESYYKAIQAGDTVYDFRIVGAFYGGPATICYSTTLEVSFDFVAQPRISP